MNKISNLRVTGVSAAIHLIGSPVGVTFYSSNRKRWGIILKAEGETVYTHEGKQYFSDSSHLMLIPKGMSYSFRCTKAGECFIIDFDAEGELGEMLSIETADSSSVIKAFSRIERALALSGGEQNIECIYAVYGILVSLLKSDRRGYVPSDKQRLVQPAVDYMIAHFQDSSITNDTLANVCDMSTVYFRKTFERVLGVSPIKYLHKLRISKAKAILKSDYGTIEQVAESVGYNSIYHFSKMFKQYTGKNPTEYAKTSRK